jgi:formylglycine-generating enzyme required for sulfatase activity
MVWIEPGSFTMGSPSSEAGRDEDEREHRVELTEGLYVGTVEVTQGVWSSVMGSNPAAGLSIGEHSLDSPAYPVIKLSWCDAVVFANALSRQDGLTPAYRLPSRFSASMSDKACEAKSGDVVWDRSVDGYRLLTESEWEYTARADSDHRYAGTSRDADICGYGNVLNPSAKAAFGFDWAPFPCEDGHHTLAPVGWFEPNAWGLYEMTGNVLEWCWVWVGEYPQNASVDPTGPSNGSARVARGGSWGFGPASVRAVNRDGITPAHAGFDLGLRLARS